MKRVIHFDKVRGTSMSMGLLDDAFDLNEYVNPVCIPSVTWVPLFTQCYITGIQGHWLNYAYRTQVVGVCEYKDNNDYKFCTKQVRKFSFVWENVFVKTSLY